MQGAVEELNLLLELLQLEQEEDRKYYEEHVLNTPLKERREAGLSCYPVVIKESFYGTGQRLILELERTSYTDIPHQFQAGRVASLFSNTSSDNKDLPRISGVVSASRPDIIKLTLFVDELPDWIDDGKLGLDLLFDESSYREMEAAVQLVRKARNCRLADLRDILLGDKTPSIREDVHPEKIPATLNDRQKEAIHSVVSASDVAIIHGPPGTGKTTTLVEAIVRTLQDEKQVLVCAPSNTAVDLLTERLDAQGVNVLRLGNPARVTEEILSHTLDVRIAKHRDFKLIKELKRSAIEYRNMALKYKRKFGKEEREQRRLILSEARRLQADAEKIEKFITDSLVNEAQVVTCTLVGAAGHFLKGKEFSTVFIDEAAQAPEPACWIPIIKANRVVLAGDHCQLPPTVKSEEAARRGLSVTLFEKCIERQEVGVMLDVQYRMNKRIMGFSGEAFYKGALKAHDSVADWSISDQSPLLSAPIEFIDTAGCGFEEAFGENTRSLINEGEANILFAYLRTILNEVKQYVSVADQQRFRVGVISPYKAQVHLLESMKENDEFFKSFGKNLSVNTVDGFQGQERDLVLISLVRSNDRGEIGFLSDIRRMNVAMTRAKKKLVVVGDSATIGQHDFYGKFLEYSEKQGVYKSAWEFM
ncbi:AAA domain-containing protein [Cytophagaceae bacterium ABcell3]|nr:AAA domain-containing protein [Cytophagaceae bacterium ABcell3]